MCYCGDGCDQGDCYPGKEPKNEVFKLINGKVYLSNNEIRYFIKDDDTGNTYDGYILDNNKVKIITIDGKYGEETAFNQSIKQCGIASIVKLIRHTPYTSHEPVQNPLHFSTRLWQIFVKDSTYLCFVNENEKNRFLNFWNTPNES